MPSRDPSPPPPRVAVLGCGYWGKNLVRNFRALGALYQVCDIDSSRLAGPPGQSEVSFTNSYQEILEEQAVEAVVIATPAADHYRHTRAALLANKDVFVEKPLALTCEEGGELVEMASDRGCILMVGHVLEYHPAVTRLLQLLEDGALGILRYIYSHRLSLGKIRSEENILWSFAPHDIAVILRMIGKLPLEVSAFGGSYLQPNIADVTVTHLLFDKGVRAHIHVSWLHPFKEQRLVMIGSRKMASFDDVGKRLILYDQRVEIGAGGPVPIKSDGEEVHFSEDEPLRLECEAFLEAVQSRRPPRTDGASGQRVLNVLQAAQQSLIMNGQPVVLPFEKQVVA